MCHGLVHISSGLTFLLQVLLARPRRRHHISCHFVHSTRRLLENRQPLTATVRLDLSGEDADWRGRGREREREREREGERERERESFTLTQNQLRYLSLSVEQKCFSNDASTLEKCEKLQSHFNNSPWYVSTVNQSNGILWETRAIPWRRRPAVLCSQRSHGSRQSAPRIYQCAAPPYQPTLWG